MHYDIRDIKVNFGTVYLYVRGEKGFVMSTLDGFEGKCTYEQLLEIGRGLYEGDFQFTKPAKCHAKKVYEWCKEKHGTPRKHADKKYRERFANDFARRMCA